MATTYLGFLSNLGLLDMVAFCVIYVRCCVSNSDRLHFKCRGFQETVGISSHLADRKKLGRLAIVDKAHRSKAD
jgi:hypothetical protein